MNILYETEQNLKEALLNIWTFSVYCTMYQHLNAQLNVQHAADKGIKSKHTSALSHLLLSSLAFAVTKSILSALSSALALSTA